MTETNMRMQESRKRVPVEMEVSGVRVQLSFAESENSDIKDRVIEILSDSYERRRLGGNTPEGTE